MPSAAVAVTLYGILDAAEPGNAPKMKSEEVSLGGPSGTAIAQ